MPSVHTLGSLLLCALATSSCVGSPSGPAADLYRERPDTVAMALARGDLPGRGPDAIEPYLQQVVRLPETPIESGDPLIDDASRIYAKLFRETVAIVRASNATLELFPDAGSFLAANWTLSPTELQAAVRQFDSQPDAEPIGPKLSGFYKAQRQIFDRNSEITRTLAYDTLRLIDPQSWLISVLSQIGSVVGDVGSTLGVQREGTTTVCTPRSGGKCVTRPTSEYNRLRERAISVISRQRQAIADGNAYIRFFEEKLASIKGMGVRVNIPAVAATLSEITKREIFDYAFDVRTIQIPEPPEAAWAIVDAELRDRGHEIALRDPTLGLIVTNLARQGFLALVFTARRYYTKYYVLISPAPLSGNLQETTKIEFKRFVYTSRQTQTLSPISGVFELKPTYEKDLKADKEEGFIESIRARAASR